MSTMRIFLPALVLFATAASGFVCQPQPTVLAGRFGGKPLYGKKERDGGVKDETETRRNPLIKASWYAAETFGKVFGRGRKQKEEQQEGKSSAEEPAVAEETTEVYDISKPPASLKETLCRLKQDNEREYFLSGQMDTLIYDVDCEFADPFVSFTGRDRFVENLANLGSFITKYSVKPLGYREQVLPSEGTASDATVETKFMVKLELNLPWKPVLAWPWGVLCQIDRETNLIVLHKESWDIDAWEGFTQVFRQPTTTV